MAAVLWAWMRIPLFASGGFVGLVGSSLYYFQNEIIYPRNIPPDARTEIPVPPTFGIQESDYEDLRLPTPDGETIHAYLLRPPNRQHAHNVTFIFFHGNAGNIGHRLPIAKIIAEDLLCNILMVEYRGYGASTGYPAEKGLKVDAQTGLDWVLAHEELSKTQVVVYGQSLGGAVSISLVGAEQNRGKVAALVLENTFLSIRKMVPVAMPVAKYLTPLCHQIWPSEKVMPTIKNVPVLFLSGLKDEIVPPSQMRRLYDISTASTKIWRELPDGDHNNTVAAPDYFQFISDFLEKHLGASGKGFKR